MSISLYVVFVIFFIILTKLRKRFDWVPRIYKTIEIGDEVGWFRIGRSPAWVVCFFRINFINFCLLHCNHKKINSNMYFISKFLGGCNCTFTNCFQVRVGMYSCSMLMRKTQLYLLFIKFVFCTCHDRKSLVTWWDLYEDNWTREYSDQNLVSIC